jgi:hypothetical protein
VCQNFVELVAGLSFFSQRVVKFNRAQQNADWTWHSAEFSGIFLASGFSYISSIVHARPHAGNANPWAAGANAKQILKT